MVFGLKHFNQYLTGRYFMIYSGHKPLIYLFSGIKHTPAMASAQIQRWGLTLSSYDYGIRYRQGYQKANADGC